MRQGTETTIRTWSLVVTVNHILRLAKRVRTEMRRKFDRPESAQDSFTGPLGLASHPERASLSTLGALFLQRWRPFVPSTLEDTQR